MEALSKMVSAIVNGGFFLGFSVGSRNVGGLNISHLLFADDTLIFLLANLITSVICIVHCSFLCFEAILGLKINLAKSKLVPVCNVSNVEDLACILGYRISSLHMKYLSLPLGALFNARSIWDDIIENIECCLAG